MNPTLTMLDRSMSEMLLERTNANKKVKGKSIYKIIIKLLHSAQKKNNLRASSLPICSQKWETEDSRFFYTQKTSK